jgi:hypothetical protein
MPDEAERVTVAGRNSVSTVEVVEGLNVGDCVILSTCRRWTGAIASGFDNQSVRESP